MCRCQPNRLQDREWREDSEGPGTRAVGSREALGMGAEGGSAGRGVAQGWVGVMPGKATAEVPASFEAVYRAQFPRLVRSLEVACGNREVAADLVQQAFMQLWADWARVSRFESPSAWVTRVAVSRLRDHYRSIRHLASALLRLEREPQSSPAAAGGEGDTLRAALARLPLRQRIAVVLYYLDDRSIADVAVIMGVSEGTVKRHLFRAREVLRSAMKES